MAKSEARWEAYKAQVPGLAALLQKTPPAVEDATLDYQQLTNRLPEDIANWLRTETPPDAEYDWSQAIEHHWCLCDMPEGDFPRVHLYTTVQGLAEAIARREGQETAVWAMYGVPLVLTKPVNTGDSQKARYLLLPNQMAALVSTKEPFRFLEQSQLPDNLETEDEGWLGDSAYRATQQFFSAGYVEESVPFTPEIEPLDDDDDEDLHV